MTSRRALIVAGATYDDDGLAGLVSPAADATALARVLADPAVCDFTVSTVVDGRSDEVARAVEDFLVDTGRDDLLLLYISCHGLKDEHGRLYFAARNTVRDRLRSTAVAAGFVNDLLLGCRSRRKVLVLDCCYSGAFARGLRVKGDPSVHTGEQFDARGLVVLTASDATQYAFEGSVVRGRAAPSMFTACLVEGLETGGADLDGDGLVSVDDVYEYVRRRIAGRSTAQSPRKWEFDVQGRIVIARANTEVAFPTAVTTDQRPSLSMVRQPWWWLSVGVFLVIAAVLGWLTAELVAYGLRSAVKEEYRPSESPFLVSAVLAAGGWVLAYAAVDARRQEPAHWYDLTLVWLRHLAAVGLPSGWREFLRGVVAAVPVNVAVALVVSSGLTAVVYETVGSTAREKAFAPIFAVVTVLSVAGFVRRGRSRP